MKAMLIAIALIAFGADLALDNIGFSSQERTAGSAVSLDD